MGCVFRGAGAAILVGVAGLRDGSMYSCLRAFGERTFRVDDKVMHGQVV